MKAEDADEWTKSLGQIGSGFWRQIALAKRLGVPQALGLKADEWVNTRLGGYVKLAISERLEAVKELAAEGMSQRDISDVVGIKQPQVNRDLKKISSHDTNVSPTTTSLQGKNDIRPSDDTNVSDDPITATAALAADEKIRNAIKVAASRDAKEKQNRADLERPVDFNLIDGLRHDDFRAGSDVIPDASVQLVFTDPPYDKESIALYSDATRVAARILRPGGSFIAYSGQRHLPEVLAACSVYLDYWWTIAGVHAGGNQILQKLGIRCGWKPLVWFVKGSRGDVQNVLADVVSGDREKSDHEWQQAEQEAQYYIEKLTSADGMVVDFFAGSGTTCAAAKKLGRRWIGFEINASSAERASKRIEAAV